jgi:hypothetical protein
MSETQMLPDLMQSSPALRRLILASGLSDGATAERAKDWGYDLHRDQIRRARKSNHKTALILSDWQCDLHDEDFLWRVYELADTLRPHVIVHVGDESDNTTIGRWVRGVPDEVEGNLQTQIDITREWLRRFRNIPSVRQMGIVSSNHGVRFETSINSRLPAFRHLRALKYEELFGLNDFDIGFHSTWEFFPGVLAGHGDQWNLTSKGQYTKLTEVASHKNKCIVAGHTHRPLITSVAGDRRDLWVMNVGHSMDITKADYMGIDRGGIDQWGQAVGIVHFNGLTAHPELVIDVAGSMQWRGKYY